MSEKKAPISPAPTPLEAAGLKPVWAENFTNAAFDCMRMLPAFGMLDDFDTFLLPGAFHFGHKHCSDVTEQKLQYYRDIDAGEPFAQTTEWTIGLTRLGKKNPEFGGNINRLYFRVRSHCDGGLLVIRGPDEPPVLRHRPPVQKPARKVIETPQRLSEELHDLQVRPGDWVHCVYAYCRDPRTLECKSTFSANGVMFSWSGPSCDPPELPFRENWSLEWRSNILPADGWYIRAVRGYAEYLEPERVRSIVSAGLEDHLSNQPLIDDLASQYDQRVPLIKANRDKCNITEPPANGIPREAKAKSLQRKSPNFFVRVPKGEMDDVYYESPMLILKRPNPYERNVHVMFDAMRLLKVEYDTRGQGRAEGAYQSSFRIGAGLTGWVDNLRWHTIAEQSGLTEGRLFTFYPDINARGLIIDRVSVVKDGEPADFWFWNLRNLTVTGIPIDDPFMLGGTFKADRTRILPLRFTEITEP